MKIIIWQKFLFLFLYVISSPLFAETDYVLCIDGGGSKTILQVLDAQGRLIDLRKNNAKLEKIEAASSNINNVGKEGVKAVFHSLFNDVQIDDGSTTIADILPYCRVVAGIAGTGLLENKQSIIALFEEYGIRREHILLMSDAELALQLIDDEGIILISGTGSVCFGKKNNTVYRVGGLGRILGDEGSGYQIGLQALKAAFAEEYGWGTPTSLTPALKEFFNVTELKTLISKINLGEMQPSKIASTAPLVFNEAWQGDSIANEIISSAAKDLADLLVKQLKISDLSNCELHLWGGIFKNTFVDAFIQKIMNGIDSCYRKRLKIVNKSSENAAVVYASKFNSFKE